MPLVNPGLTKGNGPAPYGGRKLKNHHLLLALFCLVAFVLGNVNFKASSLKVSEFEAQGIELNIQGVIPHAK